MSLFSFGFTGDSGKDGEKKKNVKGREETKTRYEKEKRKRPFLPKWKNDFRWLEYNEVENVMFCIACRKFNQEENL